MGGGQDKVSRGQVCVRPSSQTKGSDVLLRTLGSCGRVRQGRNIRLVLWETPRWGKDDSIRPLGGCWQKPPCLTEQTRVSFHSGAPRDGIAMHTHPDARDARGARRPIFTHQSLLTLLATFTVRPRVTPVPLGWKGMRREESMNKSPSPSEAPHLRAPFGCP